MYVHASDPSVRKFNISLQAACRRSVLSLSGLVSDEFLNLLEGMTFQREYKFAKFMLFYKNWQISLLRISLLSIVQIVHIVAKLQVLWFEHLWNDLDTWNTMSPKSKNQTTLTFLF